MSTTDPLNVEFVRLLAKSGWGKSQTAHKLELTPAAITRYLSGETRPSLTTLKLFKLMIGDMEPLPGTDEMMDQAPMLPMTAEEAELIKTIRSIRASKQQPLIEMLESFTRFIADER